MRHHLSPLCDTVSLSAHRHQLYHCWHTHTSARLRKRSWRKHAQIEHIFLSSPLASHSRRTSCLLRDARRDSLEVRGFTLRISAPCICRVRTQQAIEGYGGSDLHYDGCTEIFITPPKSIPNSLPNSIHFVSSCFSLPECLGISACVW